MKLVSVFLVFIYSFAEMRWPSAIIMPDDIAEEKVQAIRALGAEVERVRPASIVDKKQVR